MQLMLSLAGFADIITHADDFALFSCSSGSEETSFLCQGSVWGCFYVSTVQKSVSLLLVIEMPIPVALMLQNHRWKINRFGQ